MERLIFNFVKVFKGYILGKAFGYILLFTLACLLIINVLFLTIKRYKYYFKKHLNLIFLALFLLIFSEFFAKKVVFKTFDSCFIIFGVIALFERVVYEILTMLKGKNNRAKIKGKSVEQISENYGSLVKKAVEKITLVEEGPKAFSGYVDIAYVKGLINSLKKQNLEENDSLELEELEVYLLNFANRQPNSLERLELSKKLGSLIKKLAKYAC